jgi:hypothetical protein
MWENKAIMNTIAKKNKVMMINLNGMDTTAREWWEMVN